MNIKQKKLTQHTQHIISRINNVNQLLIVIHINSIVLNDFNFDASLLLHDFGCDCDCFCLLLFAMDLKRVGMSMMKTTKNVNFFWLCDSQLDSTIDKNDETQNIKKIQRSVLFYGQY